MDNEIPNEYIGMEVNVKVDRPLGTKHPKDGFMYMLNCGYISDNDGEKLDVYLLGEFEPVEECRGKVIAVIHRINSNKLVVSANGKDYSDDAIRALTEFQEKDYGFIIVRSNSKKKRRMRIYYN